MNVIKQHKLYRMITHTVYNGCIPVTAFIIQKRQERTFLPDKWITVKGYDDRTKAEALWNTLT